MDGCLGTPQKLHQDRQGKAGERQNRGDNVGHAVPGGMGHDFILCLATRHHVKHWYVMTGTVTLSWLLHAG